MIMFGGSVFARPFAKTHHVPRAKKYISHVSLHLQDRVHAPIYVCLGKEGVQCMHSVKLASSDFGIPEQHMGNSGNFENADCF